MEELDREKITAWLNEKWQGPKLCPVCGHNDWLILDRAWEAREFYGGPLKAGSKLLPLVCVMCRVCGHTLMFNAITMGVVEPSEKTEEEHG